MNWKFSFEYRAKRMGTVFEYILLSDFRCEPQEMFFTRGCTITYRIIIIQYTWVATLWMYYSFWNQIQLSRVLKLFTSITYYIHRDVKKTFMRTLCILTTHRLQICILIKILINCFIKISYTRCRGIIYFDIRVRCYGAKDPADPGKG